MTLTKAEIARAVSDQLFEGIRVANQAVHATGARVYMPLSFEIEFTDGSRERVMLHESSKDRSR